MSQVANDNRVNVWCLPLLHRMESGQGGKGGHGGHGGQGGPGGQIGAHDEVATARMLAMLSSEEKAIASGLDSPERRQSYIAAHALLRTILSRVTGIAPNELVFRYGRRGKPELAVPASHDIQFNMAHSRDVVIVAVAHGRRVGVDIEHIDEPGDVRRIAARFLSPRDRNAIAELPAEHQRDAFLRCWTRKEAYMKARGDGISRPLDDFEVSHVGAPASLLSVAGDPNEAERWELADLPAPRGFMAALAVEGHGFEVVQHLDLAEVA